MITIFYFFNSNVRFLRKKNNMTIPQLAKSLGVSKSTIDAIECGATKSSLDVIDKIHKLFDISIDDLIYKDLSK